MGNVFGTRCSDCHRSNGAARLRRRKWRHLPARSAGDFCPNLIIDRSRSTLLQQSESLAADLDLRRWMERKDEAEHGEDVLSGSCARHMSSPSIVHGDSQVTWTNLRLCIHFLSNQPKNEGTSCEKHKVVRAINPLRLTPPAFIFTAHLADFAWQSHLGQKVWNISWSIRLGVSGAPAWP